jgi:hypothetical protein
LAGDIFFKRGHHDGCEKQTIRLPAQRVEVETTAPRITVHETTRVSRGFAPVIGTIYMPLAMPLAGVGFGRGTDPTCEDDYDALRTAHLAERATLRHEQARSALRAEVEAKQRVLERMGPLSASRSPCLPPDLDSRLREVSEQIGKLTERVLAVERLTLTHDNYIREQLQRNPAPK